MTLPPTDPLDTVLSALCLLREAEGESVQAKTGIWHVIVNRAEDALGRWPKTIHGVVCQPGQFSSFNTNNPRAGVWPRESLTAQWLAWLDCLSVVECPLAADPTNGANFYHDESIPPPAVQWLGPGATVDELLAKKTVDIGRLSFYKL